MAEKKPKQYVSDNAQLMAEWNWEKNNDLELYPHELTCGSHKKVWWKCNKGHEWQAAISKRNSGQGCPFCSGKKALKGYNDLSTTNPELVSEWDFDKNETPIHAYRPMSNKKVWWICEKGHSWEATIAKRTNGEKCPACQGKRIQIGFNDLTSTHPSLIEEWDYDKNTKLSPTDVSKGSSEKVWWKCKLNHTWQSSIYSRVAGVGCPHCAKELQTSFPEKAIFFYVKKMCPDAIANYHSDKLSSFELDVFIPSLQIGIEYDGEYWHRSIEKDLSKNKLCAEMGILLFRIREPACPKLLDRLSVCIVRDSKNTGLDKAINTLLSNISKKFGIDCSINVDFKKDSTSILELLTPIEKENSILSRNPNLAKEWDYQKNGVLLPNMVTPGSDKKVWWICNRGHSYLASISSRIRGRGCPTCSGKKVLKGFNDFESHCPELAKDWDYTKNSTTPDMVAYGSDKKFWWICTNGHSYECSINNRRSGQSCCYCSGKKVLAGFNDISTTHPDIAEQWCADLNDIKPTEISAGSSKKVWWQCNVCEYRWISNVYNRCHNKSGCPKCSGRVK